MSVRYSTRLGYGYVVNQDMLRDLDKDKFYEFLEDDWTLAANNYDEENTSYFFGILQGYLQPGYIMRAPTRRNYTHQELSDMIDKFHYYFPNQNDYLCRDYIISCID